MAYREIRGLLRYLPMASLPPWRELDCASAKLLHHLRLKMRLQKPQILVSLTHAFGQQIGSAFVADAVRGVYGGPNLCHERSKTLGQGANVLLTRDGF